MRTVPTLYYLFSLFLILGGFASMAQNDYGLKIIGITGIGFAMVFTYQSVRDFIVYRTLHIDIIQYLCLGMVSLILSFRALFIRFEYIEWVFSVTSLILFTLFVYKSYILYRENFGEHKLVKLLISLFYIGISLFFLSLTLTLFAPVLSVYIGGLGFGLIVLFAFAHLKKFNRESSDEKFYLIQKIVLLKDPSVIVASLVVILSIYVGMNQMNIFPDLYSNEYPQAYLELIKKAESGDEEMIDGKYEYEVYKEYYDKIIEKYISKEGP